MERVLGQMDLGEAWFSPKLGRNARLERIESAFDWERLQAVVGELHAGRTGRPAWPTAVMLKALLLAGWYGFSDAALEAALSDRLSLRRFVGLASDEGSPDRTVISRFRRKLRERGLEAPFRAEIARQLAARGLTVRRGVQIDPMLAPAKAQSVAAAA